MNSPPGINAIEPVSLGVPYRTLTSELAVKVYEVGYVVIGNKNVDWGLIMIVESLDRKTFSGEENGEMVPLLIPTWHCWHSGRVVRFFLLELYF
jgi:hypothetical protein